MNTTLLIIDLQDKFYPDPDVIKNTLKLIAKFKKEQAPIVVMEYQRHGATVNKIRKALVSYPHTYFATKTEDSGALEFLEVAQKNQLPLKTIVAGVNRGYCVFETVQSLNSQGFKSKVVEEATWSNYKPTEELDWLRNICEVVSLKEVLNANRIE